MVDIHEYQAKELLSGFGVPVQQGAVAYSAEHAVYCAMEVGGGHWAVKAQIHSRPAVSSCAGRMTRCAPPPAPCWAPGW
jgi:acyl-CoA synthetase (NDP forming)